MKYLSFILVGIAGITKAIMDTLQFHFSQSVFKGINDQYWNAAISWQNKYETWLPVMFTDGWHLFQSIFLTTLFFIIIIYTPIVKWNNKSNWYMKLLDLFILRSIFGLAFVLFYNYILIK